MSPYHQLRHARGDDGGKSHHGAFDVYWTSSNRQDATAAPIDFIERLES